MRTMSTTRSMGRSGLQQEEISSGTGIFAMLPAHRARILFFERSAEASHVEVEGVG